MTDTYIKKLMLDITCSIIQYIYPHDFENGEFLRQDCGGGVIQFKACNSQLKLEGWQACICYKSVCAYMWKLNELNQSTRQVSSDLI